MLYFENPIWLKHRCSVTKFMSSLTTVRDSYHSSSLWTFPVCWDYFLVHNRGFSKSVAVCGSVSMLEDTTVACLSSHKWTEDKSIQGAFREVIAFFFLSLSFVVLCLLKSCSFLFWESHIFILLSRSFLLNSLTSSYPSSSVTFSDLNVRPH